MAVSWFSMHRKESLVIFSLTDVKQKGENLCIHSIFFSFIVMISIRLIYLLLVSYDKKQFSFL